MRHRFLHVAFSFAHRIKVQELEGTFNAIGDDWVRISALSWILWTNKPAAHVFALLEPRLDPADQILIHEFSSGAGMRGANMFAKLSPWIWAWLNSKVPNFAIYGPQIDAWPQLPRSAFEENQ